MEPANADSWKRDAFQGGVPLPCAIALSSDEFARVRLGLIPKEMEDKWFIYYEDPFLHFHRSWTGQPVYRLRFLEKDSVALVEEALWSDALATSSQDSGEYQGELVRFLMNNLLLGKATPFPRPAGVREPAPGIYQHHVAGTGYPERPVQARKPWWKWW